jgi:hypothetical protein
MDMHMDSNSVSMPPHPHPHPHPQMVSQQAGSGHGMMYGSATAVDHSQSQVHAHAQSMPAVSRVGPAACESTSGLDTSYASSTLGVASSGASQNSVDDSILRTSSNEEGLTEEVSDDTNLKDQVLSSAHITAPLLSAVLHH